MFPLCECSIQFLIMFVIASQSHFLSQLRIMSLQSVSSLTPKISAITAVFLIHSSTMLFTSTCSYLNLTASASSFDNLSRLCTKKEIVFVLCLISFKNSRLISSGISSSSKIFSTITIIEVSGVLS